MIALWVLATAAGLTLAAWASARGVDHAVRAASGLGVSPFLVGFTLVAIGTDLPEIANSIAASLAGQGDVNVGDSIGSAAAQATLAIGLAPLLARGFPVVRRNVALLGGWAVALLLVGVLLLRDGDFSRLDAAILVVGWALAAWQVWTRSSPPEQPELPLPEHHPWRHVGTAVGFLVLVVGGAWVAVTGIVEVAGSLGLPSYLVSFIGLALGTSLPEVVVVVSAARQGQGDLAVGDALGASLADASLSVGLGPLIAPTAVTAGLVVRGGLLTAGAVGIATLALVVVGRHNRWTGALLVGLYLVTLPLLALAA